ncbi:MAG: hypothetical protein R3B09_27065 [Nannocystaceae bacterium]
MIGDTEGTDSGATFVEIDNVLAALGCAYDRAGRAFERRQDELWAAMSCAQALQVVMPGDRRAEVPLLTLVAPRLHHLADMDVEWRCRLVEVETTSGRRVGVRTLGPVSGAAGASADEDSAIHRFKITISAPTRVEMRLDDRLLRSGERPRGEAPSVALGGTRVILLAPGDAAQLGATTIEGPVKASPRDAAASASEVAEPERVPTKPEAQERPREEQRYGLAGAALAALQALALDGSLPAVAAGDPNDLVDADLLDTLFSDVPLDDDAQARVRAEGAAAEARGALPRGEDDIMALEDPVVGVTVERPLAHDIAPAPPSPAPWLSSRPKRRGRKHRRTLPRPEAIEAASDEPLSPVSQDAPEVRTSPAIAPLELGARNQKGAPGEATTPSVVSEINRRKRIRPRARGDEIALTIDVVEEYDIEIDEETS